jgi:hypothetical protein
VYSVRGRVSPNTPWNTNIDFVFKAGDQTCKVTGTVRHENFCNRDTPNCDDLVKALTGLHDGVESGNVKAQAVFDAANNGLSIVDMLCWWIETTKPTPKKSPCWGLPEAPTPLC